jgi:hypothetical protein
MTPPTTPATRRRPRRASLLAALTGTVLAFGLIAGGGIAQAATPPASVYLGADEWCHLNNSWGGNFFCPVYTQNYWYQMPNGYWEVFVEGTNYQAWTRWNSSNGLSSWKSLGGHCILGYIQFYASNPNNGWNWAIRCEGTDYNWWYDTRSGGPDGSWSGWSRTTNV